MTVLLSCFSVLSKGTLTRSQQDLEVEELTLGLIDNCSTNIATYHPKYFC